MNGSICFVVDNNCKNSRVGVEFLVKRISYFFPDVPVFFGMEEVPPHQIVINCLASCPILDEVSLMRMIRASLDTGKSFTPVDEVIGTAPFSLINRQGRELFKYFYDTQPLFGTNFSIGRSNREKVFQILCEAGVLHPELTFEEVVNRLEKDSSVDSIISYGCSEHLNTYEDCPYCGSSSVQQLSNGTGHPILGFLTKNVSIYSHCYNCDLTFMKRQLTEAMLHVFYGEYAYPSSETSADLIEKFRALSDSNTSHYSSYVAINPALKSLSENARVADFGCGHGEFAAYVKQVRPESDVFAFDWRVNEPVQVALASIGVSFTEGDIFERIGELVATGQSYDLITFWEVIEHFKIERLKEVFVAVRSLLTDDGVCFMSTPDFNDYHAQALDFWSMAPGEHISVLSRRFLEPLLSEVGLQIFAEEHESVMFKLPGRWFKHGATTNPHFSSKALSRIVDDFLEDDVAREAYRQRCRENKVGSELIIGLRKIQPH